MSRFSLHVQNPSTVAVLYGVLALGLGPAAIAGTHCVNPAGSNGCSSTISAAVAAASPGDTINVGPGQYAENVVINKSISLVGSGSEATIINAKGLPNGIYVDGLDNSGLSNVLITGFTILNANYEGILVTNTSYSFITRNHIASNTQMLDYAAGTCAGLPEFETSEGEDCGEGIHLAGVHHTTVANNIVELNSGGILLSDETGMTYSNTISGNSVHDNILDCGITLASHPPAPQAGSPLPFGVINNVIIGNTASRNGIVGFGAGIGIYAPGPGNQAYGNQVIGNTIENNGLPGIAIHNHAAPPGAPGINLNDTMIVGNYISGNGADSQDAATPGTAGINIYSVGPAYATTILNNTIVNQVNGIVMNNPGSMEAHLNNLLTSGVGILNLGSGTLDGTLNYFGCAGGPGASGCGSVKGSQLTATPWLNAPAESAPQARNPR